MSAFDGITPSPISGHEGWQLFSAEPNGPSKIVRPDGATAFYRYLPTSHDDAILIAWAYSEGRKHGDIEARHSIKVILGL